MDYKDDKTWLMHGDCLERMKDIPDGSVDMVLTDPPYNISRDNNFSSMGKSVIDCESKASGLGFDDGCQLWYTTLRKRPQ